jgi:hypothetical protein
MDMGVPKEKVLGIKHNVSKAKYAASELRSILSSSNLEEKEKAEQVLIILEDVVNPDIHVDKFLAKKKARAYANPNVTQPIEGQIVTLPHGEILLIKSPETSFTMAMQHALKGLVDGWSPVDAVELATRLTDSIYTKDKYKLTSLDFDRLSQNGNIGIEMPTPQRFKDLCLIELGRSGRYINQLIDEREKSGVFMKVFEVGPKFRTKVEGIKHLSDSFHTQEQGVFSRLDKAVSEFYTYPEELDIVYSVKGPCLYWRVGTAIEIGVHLCMQSDGSEILPAYENSGEEEMPISG